ncbi:20960_t:CDS:1 [Racocetra persica]|uniref:20960_t:CDS:1 n=1 Tax=Racocetra persica TaxID=160502 RepID=A0ACA9KSJ9_9GLOM|nr:20960_t:CDS:1 [Racocetra persica]
MLITQITSFFETVSAKISSFLEPAKISSFLKPISTKISLFLKLISTVIILLLELLEEVISHVISFLNDEHGFPYLHCFLTYSSFILTCFLTFSPYVPVSLFIMQPYLVFARPALSYKVQKHNYDIFIQQRFFILFFLLRHGIPLFAGIYFIAHYETPIFYALAAIYALCYLQIDIFKKFNHVQYSIQKRQEVKERRRDQQLNVNEEVKQYNILYFFRFGYYYLISTTTEIRKTCFARTFDDLFDDIDLNSLENKGIKEKFAKDDLVIQHDQTKFTEKQLRLIELDVVAVYRQRTVYISKSASDSMPTNYISVTPFFRSTKHEWKRFSKSKEASFDYY